MMTSQVLRSVDFIKSQKRRYLENGTSFLLQIKKLIIHQRLLYGKKQFRSGVTFEFLGVLLNWKEHIKYTENKIAKNLRLLYKARPFLDKNTLRALYYSYIQTYIDYANISWGSTCSANLKLTVVKNMQYILLLIKTSLRTQGKSLSNRIF